MANNLKRVSSSKWPGVYCYESDQRKYKGNSDVCYYITFKIDGRKKTEKIGWRSEGFTPEAAAELRAGRVRACRHDRQEEISEDNHPEMLQAGRTIEDLKEAYFASIKGMNLKGRKTDLNRYRRHLEKPFAGRRAEDLRPEDIEHLKKELRGYAPATIANVLELLRRIVNHGSRNGLCSPLPFALRLPVKDNQVTEYLTSEQAERLMRVLKEWKSQDAPRMLQIVWLTGMRRGEIFRLEDRDCDFNQKQILLRGQKSGKTEIIPMSEPVALLLKDQLASRGKNFPDSPFVFPGKEGRMRTDSSAVDRIKEKANLPKKFRIFHGLRHHLAVTLARSGEFTLDMIGSLLIQKSSEMTRRYARFLPDAKRKAADQAAELLKAHATGNGRSDNEL